MGLCSLHVCSLGESLFQASTTLAHTENKLRCQISCWGVFGHNCSYWLYTTVWDDDVDWGAITGFDVMGMDLAWYDLLVRLLIRLLWNDWTLWVWAGVRPSKWWLYLSCSCLCWLGWLWFPRQMLINKNHLFFRTLRLWLWPFGRSWSWTWWSWRRPELRQDLFLFQFQFGYFYL